MAIDRRENARKGLDALARLGPNWDGCGAEPIRPEAIAEARWFLENLPSDLIPPVHAVPMTRGRLQFEWRLDGERDLELEFRGDGIACFLKWLRAIRDGEEGDVDISDQDAVFSLVRWLVPLPEAVPDV
jgi:hypothetical protein